MVNVELRPLRVGDLELVFAWRSNPRVYEYFRDQSEPLEWADHLQWFATRPPERSDFVIEYGGRRVGVVAVTAADEVSIYLGEPGTRGQGVATAALTEAIECVERATFTAWIHRENRASQRLFERCGFERDGSDGDWLRYAYENGN